MDTANIQSDGIKNLIKHYSQYVTAYGFIQVFLEAHNLKGSFDKLGSPQEGLDSIRRFYFNNLPKVINQADSIKFNNSLDEAKNKFKAKIGNAFCYEFSEGDLTRIQTLVNELRELISKSDKFESDHKGRLLKRLEKLQGELHKKVSDLDRFWGFVGDAGVVLGKFGKDAKPFVDRVREIVGIVWSTQARAEELESNSPNLLLNPKDNEE